eukprot:GHVQ01038998.1.p1 GENE.GHVQ01038998.1~~GHVQ01038998.1.p1  ORF type:complete len:344 (+),score=63.56 GHVQ01038998.1:824-1855(+)
MSKVNNEGNNTQKMRQHQAMKRMHRRASTSHEEVDLAMCTSLVDLPKCFGLNCDVAHSRIQDVLQANPHDLSLVSELDHQLILHVQFASPVNLAHLAIRADTLDPSFPAPPSSVAPSPPSPTTKEQEEPSSVHPTVDDAASDTAVHPHKRLTEEAESARGGGAETMGDGAGDEKSAEKSGEDVTKGAEGRGEVGGSGVSEEEQGERLSGTGMDEDNGRDNRQDETIPAPTSVPPHSIAPSQPVASSSSRPPLTEDKHTGPRLVKLYSNNVQLDFSEAENTQPDQIIELSPELLDGRKIPLRGSKFQRCKSVQIFVEENIGDTLFTFINRIAVWGFETPSYGGD